MSFSDLKGIILIKERKKNRFNRIKREIKRSGYFRILDIIAFKIYHKIYFSKLDNAWLNIKLESLKKKYPYDCKNIPTLIVDNPNCKEAEEFLLNHKPDITLARCKVLLKEKIFSIAKIGTFVMHPGICPEYRNSHGCFWAIVNNDYKKVGMTLLEIDKGIDTGPIHGYYYCKFDMTRESHIIIQNRVVIENLESVKDKIIKIFNEKSKSKIVSTKNSKIWGQPWLTSYLKWKINASK